MKWWMIAAATRTLASLPGGPGLHARLRERSGELANLENSSRFDNALWFVKTARRWCGELSTLRVVEFGTGWVPALPLAMLLCGARVETYDVQRLTNWDLVLRTLHALKQRAAQFAAAAEFPLEMFLQRLDVAETSTDLETACQALCGRYVAPCDTLHLPLKDGEADLVVSNLVLQCIPAELLREVLQESRRVLRPDGFAIHRMRMTDEYARRDQRRNHLEYLKYSDATWNRWFCHRLKHQNRLRASQFLSVFDELGFECRWTGRSIDGESVSFVESLPLADEFVGLESKDLATINLDVVLQRPGLADVERAAGDVPPVIKSGGELNVSAS